MTSTSRLSKLGLASSLLAIASLAACASDDTGASSSEELTTASVHIDWIWHGLDPHANPNQPDDVGPGGLPAISDDGNRIGVIHRDDNAFDFPGSGLRGYRFTGFDLRQKNSDGYEGRAIELTRPLVEIIETPNGPFASERLEGGAWDAEEYMSTKLASEHGWVRLQMKKAFENGVDFDLLNVRVEVSSPPQPSSAPNLAKDGTATIFVRKDDHNPWQAFAMLKLQAAAFEVPFRYSDRCPFNRAELVEAAFAPKRHGIFLRFDITLDGPEKDLCKMDPLFFAFRTPEIPPMP